MSAGKSTRSNALSGALSEARADLDALRDRISDFADERERVQLLSDDFKTIEARVDREIAAQMDRERVGHGTLYFSGFSRPDASSLTIGGILKQRMADNPLGVFAAMFPDALKEALLNGQPRNGITPDERASQLARIDRELFNSEIAEEVACRELDQIVGVMVPRRSDARPELLLAPDSELV